MIWPYTQVADPMVDGLVRRCERTPYSKSDPKREVALATELAPKECLPSRGKMGDSPIFSQCLFSDKSVPISCHDDRLEGR